MIITGTPGDEILTGTGDDDEISGLAGHDYLRGRLGNDILYGGDDDDLMNGSFGDDQFFGGNGFDRVSFFDLTGTITTGCKVSLMLAGVAQDTGQGMDILGRDIEHLSGTSFNDKLTGSDEANWLWAQNYDPTAAAILSNDDKLSGLGGDDCLECGLGNNILLGGDGTDTAAIRFTPGALSVSLLLQGAAQDTLQGMMTLKSIENLSGSDFDDSFTGDNRDNALLGNGGADSLYGGRGNDALYGDGWITIDTHDLGYSGPITLFAENPTTLDGFGASGEDFLDGGKGRDMLVGGGLADKMAGGQGPDTFLYLDLSDSFANSPNGDFEDLITDLSNSDIIDLSAVDADIVAPGDQNFTLVGAFSGAAGEMMLTYDAGTDTTFHDERERRYDCRHDHRHLGQSPRLRRHSGVTR